MAGLRRLLLVFDAISEEPSTEMVLASLAEKDDDPPTSLRPLPPPCAAASGASGAAVRGGVLLLLLLFRLARFFLRAEWEGDAGIFVSAFCGKTI